MARLPGAARKVGFDLVGASGQMWRPRNSAVHGEEPYCSQWRQGFLLRYSQGTAWERHRGGYDPDEQDDKYR